MKSVRFLVVLMFLAVAVILAQGGWPSHVTVVPPVERGKAVKVSGKLENGIEMPDLSWAWRSSMACFVQLQAPKFAAKHVIFATQTRLSGIGELMVRVIPTDPSVNLSLWVYASNDYRLPPNIQSVRSCEANYKWDRPFKGQTQDHIHHHGHQERGHCDRGERPGRPDDGGLHPRDQRQVRHSANTSIR